MVQFFDGSIEIYIVITLIFCFAAIMTGLALAKGWQQVWMSVPYGVLMALGARFLGFALSDGQLLSVAGVLVDSLILIVVILVSYRVMQTRKMVSQYPWLYESAGLFNWRERRSLD